MESTDTFGKNVKGAATMGSKHKPEQTEIGKHLLDEDDSEDFENLPEFEQSF